MKSCLNELGAHLYLATLPSRTAAACSAARSSGPTKEEGVSSRIFWCRLYRGQGRAGGQVLVKG